MVQGKILSMENEKEITRNTEEGSFYIQVNVYE
jgi:hypothetical protein